MLNHLTVQPTNMAKELSDDVAKKARLKIVNGDVHAEDCNCEECSEDD